MFFFFPKFLQTQKMKAFTLGGTVPCSTEQQTAAILDILVEYYAQKLYVFIPEQDKKN